MWRGAVAPAINGNLVASRFDEFRIHFFRVGHIPHADRSAESVRVRAARRVTDGFAVAVNGLAAPQHWLGILQNEDNQLPLHTRLLLLQQGITPDKWDLL